LGAFSCGDDVRSDEASAREFMETSRRRLLRIYKTWYEGLGIGRLLEEG